MEAPELEIGRSGSGLSLSLEAVQWRGSSRFRAYTQLTFISEKYVDHPHPLALSLATLLPATAQLLVAQPCLEAPAEEDIARQHLGLLSTSQQLDSKDQHVSSCTWIASGAVYFSSAVLL